MRCSLFLGVTCSFHQTSNCADSITKNKFVGVLVAPEFSPKVENVARSVDEVRLRTFKLRAK